MEELTLTSKKVEKDGKTYTDIYLNWNYEGKDYAVRVKPVFLKDFALLYAIATATDNR